MDMPASRLPKIRYRAPTKRSLLLSRLTNHAGVSPRDAQVGQRDIGRIDQFEEVAS